MVHYDSIERSFTREEGMKKIWIIVLFVVIAVFGSLFAEGTYTYDDFESSEICASCHESIYRQYDRSMMSQTFTHIWDEVEYYELALPHARKLPKVAEVEAGCNGCHAPVAFLTGDIPPKKPAEESRANDSLSCDLCHTITGFKGEVPFNFNFVVEPGETKYGTRKGGESTYHEIAVTPFLHTAEFCGTCHNEKDPYGIWVKSTHLEWKESPQGKAGVLCQDCHMTPARSASVTAGAVYDDVRQHLFHGAHDTGKLEGAAEILLYADAKKVKPGKTLTLEAFVLNAKAGHSIPSGSAEERLVWLHVEAKDARGNTYHLPVDPKGFPGEELLIADPEAYAYQDIGDIKGIDNFKGIKRDGDVPAGDRIFRLPYLDPDGRMTIAQWHTASLGVDYRLKPLEARRETFTWKVPKDLPEGDVTIHAEVFYSRLVPSVARYMKIPEEEYAPVSMNADKIVLPVVSK